MVGRAQVKRTLNRVYAASGRVQTRLLARARAVSGRVTGIQDRIVTEIFDRWAVDFTYMAFAFVFFYFGFQKPAPVDTPVRTPVSVFIDDVSGLVSALLPTTVYIPHEAALVFIGAYEMFLGLLFLFKRIRVAFWLFFAHQIVGFVAIVMIWQSVFQPPWLTVAGVSVPWALGGFSAFVLKNVVFVGAFMMLASSELGDDNA